MGQVPRKLRPEQVDDLVNHTNYSSDEVKQWYRTFSTECPSGRLNRDDFARIYGTLFPQGDATAFAHRVFDRFDIDHDGTINFREFVCGLSVASRGAVREKLDWAFGLYDIDGDGTVTLDEMEQILTSIFRMVNSQEDPAERARQLFDAMDTDHDGQLTKQEFHAAAAGDAQLLQMLTGHANSA
eukprot:m.69506 g.69506  ORF g.69506 m.69506 type:complete len:184 (-) comp12225_c1_seq4:96-647(-)